MWWLPRTRRSGPTSAQNRPKPGSQTQNRAKRINKIDIQLLLRDQEPEVQILSPRPFFIFCPFKDQVERLSICRSEVYTIRGAVQKHRFEQLAAFCVIPRKVQRISTIREY